MITRPFILLAFLFAFMNAKAQPPYVEKVIDLCVPQYGEPIGFTIKNGKIYVSSITQYGITYESGPIDLNTSQTSGFLNSIDTLGNINWVNDILNTACNEYITRGSNVIINGNHVFLAGSVQSSTDINQNFHGALFDCVSSPGPSTSDIALSKSSLNGTLQWVKCYGSYDYDGACDFILSSTRNSIVIGANITIGENADYSNPISDIEGQDMWLVEVDTANGSIIREKCFGTIGNDFMFDIINTHDNGYLISGNTYVYWPNNMNDHILIKTDSLLNEQWQLILPTPARDFGSILLEDSLSGSIYWLVSAAETDSIFHTNIQSYQIWGDDDWNTNNWVIKLDKNGNIIWTTCIGTIYKESVANGNANIIFNENNEIVITTYSDTDSSQYNGQIDIRFLKLDTLGNLLIEKNLPGLYNIADIISLGNDRYVCLANMIDENCAFELVYLGNNPLFIEEQVSNPIKIYPNPAEDFVSIKIPQNYTQAQLGIYNLTGQLISQKQVTQSNQQLSITELGNGMYIFVIQNEDKVIGRQRVMVAR